MARGSDRVCRRPAENYQTPDGVRIPDVLQPFLGGIDFLPFMQARSHPYPCIGLTQLGQYSVCSCWSQ